MHTPHESWWGDDPALCTAQERLLRMATTRLPVLLRGETGTGKELAARWLHERAGGPGRPFVAIDCGALPDGLIEAELFGCARGAYTGAVAARAGLVEAAEGGTLFLDEIGDASALLQARLLRLLAEGEFRRLGETRVRAAHVRIVAATHRDLDAQVGSGRFRSDLWYRLAAVEVELPPLRARSGDALRLADRFLARALPGARWSAAARRALAVYAWPGNVRELAWTVEVAAAGASAQAEVGVDALPARIARDVASAATGVRAELAALEHARIAQALAACGGNRARAARRLGLSRSGLWKKLRRAPEAAPITDDSETEEAWPRKS